MYMEIPKGFEVREMGITFSRSIKTFTARNRQVEYGTSTW